MIQSPTPQQLEQQQSSSRVRPQRVLAPGLKSPSFESGMCLKVLGVTSADLNSSKFTRWERELITHGYTLLDVPFDLNDDDINEVKDYLSASPNELVPVNDTYKEVKRAEKDHYTVGDGNKAPRAMIQFGSEGALKFSAVRKIVQKLKEEDVLHWVTATREFEFTALRSLPGAPKQLWHADYTLKSSGVMEMFWNSIPLSMLTAFDDNTYIDFPSGRVHIPRFQSCIFRGDKVHRGMGNDSAFENCRGFSALDSPTSRRYRLNSAGEATFEPVPEEEQALYEQIFRNNMQPSAGTSNPPVDTRKKKKKKKKIA
jgi:hypothetical protein